MSQFELSDVMECGKQLLAVLSGDDTDAITLQRLLETSQQVAALRLKQQQQLKDDIQYLTSDLNDTYQSDLNGDGNRLDDLESSLKSRVDSIQSQSATVKKECQNLKEHLSEVQREQQTLKEQRQSQKDARTAGLSKARCDANLYSNITNLRWQYNCEPHEIKGFISNKHEVKTFNLNSQEVSRFFITNYLWDLIEEDW
ncbi:kinetochore protein Spc24-like [Babylonia areolata]|uniref:kinetochore protein Spc24-like n=1 Tax=Babylonia areolata TaxID=304850 RepID=UPI003FD1427A